MDPLEKNYGNGPTLQVARWVAGLSYRDLPERTKSVVRLTLLDTRKTVKKRAPSKTAAKTKVSARKTVKKVAQKTVRKARKK